MPRTKPKDIGTRGETAVVNLLIAKGFNARRVVLHGTVDHGDIHCELPNGEVLVIQVKVGRYAETASMEERDRWLGEAERQAGAAGASLAVLVCKVPGRGDARVGDWELSYREPFGRASTRLGNITGWIKESQ